MIIITIKDSLYFVYDGISSQDMGIINVNIDSGLQSEPFYPSASILEISTRYNETPYFQKIKREPLVFNLTFAFEDGFDDDKLRETARWLNQKTFKELYFSNQPDKKYFAIYEGSPRLFHTGADGYFEITFRTNSPYAHSNLIETGIYNQVSPTFTFTRPSPAIHPDTGAEVPADTPIYVDFAEGRKGSLMVDGTVNYNPDPFLEDIDNFNLALLHGGGGYLEQVPAVIYGDAAVKMVCTAAGTLRLYHKSPTETFTEGETVTTSIILKTLKALNLWDVNFGLRTVGGVSVGFMSGSNLGIQEIVENIYKITATFTVESTTAAAAGIQFFNCEVGDYFIIDALQAERKAYPTPIHDGTRANPAKQITLPEPLPEEFGVGVWFKPLHTTIPVTRTWLRIHREPYSNNNRIYIITAKDVTYVACGFVRDGTTYSSGLGGAVEAGKITGIYYHQEPGKYTLYVRKHNGEIVSDSTNVTALTGLTTILVGCSVPATQYAANATLADFVLHDRPEDIDPEGYLSRVPGGGST